MKHIALLEELICYKIDELMHDMADSGTAKCKLNILATLNWKDAWLFLQEAVWKNKRQYLLIEFPRLVVSSVQNQKKVR